MPANYAVRMKLFKQAGGPQLPIVGLELVLHRNQPLRLAAARGCRLRCTRGCAWLTAPDEPRDIYLFAGDAWDVHCDGLILVEAASAAMASIRVE
jgi:hypothetical protein